MKKLLGLAVVVLIVVGVVKLASGRSDEAKATMVCEQIVELCGSAMRREGIDISKSDIDECAADVAKEAPRDLGSSYEPFVDCVEDADTRGEITAAARDSRWA
jgi:hypothetical protein